MIHQKEDAIPWVAAVSASVGIVHAEPAVGDLVFRQLTSDEIQSSTRRPRYLTNGSLQETWISPISGRAEKRDAYNISSDGILWRQTKSRLQLVLPIKFKQLIYQELRIEKGHLGAD